MKLTFHTLNDGILEYEVEQNSVLIGRGSSCDVILKIEGISRQHCRIEATDRGEFLVTDLGSTNGVLIDNERIPSNQPIPYAPYLHLSIGSVPQVTLESTTVIREEKVVLTKSKKSADLNIELDLPQKKKMGKSAGRGYSDSVKVSSAVPWRLVGIAVTVLLALSYYFLSGS